MAVPGSDAFCWGGKSESEGVQCVWQESVDMLEGIVLVGEWGQK